MGTSLLISICRLQATVALMQAKACINRPTGPRGATFLNHFFLDFSHAIYKFRNLQYLEDNKISMYVCGDDYADDNFANTISVDVCSRYYTGFNI